MQTSSRDGNIPSLAHVTPACRRAGWLINQDGGHGVAGMFGPLEDKHRPVFGQFPHGLGVVERTTRAEEDHEDQQN
jgi:hypothetical protein